MRVRASDLSGNTTVSEPLSFRVNTPFPRVIPFERTQVVWVRFDLDRNGNGRSDLEDDLMLLGLTTERAPADITSHMIEVIADGIVAQASQLFGRSPSSSLLDGDSVAIRLTHRQPLGVPHMQIGVGGFDPEGETGRGFGDESSGILGRALYD